MQRIRALAAALLATAFAGPAAALTAADVRLYLAAGDIEGMQAAFVIHQAKFAARDLDQNAYLRPFEVFETTDPVAQKVARDWLAAFPESAHAMTARANAVSYLAILFRGNGFAGETPSRALTEMSVRLREALPLYRSAIEREPAHLAAAYGLLNAAAFAGDKAGRETALDVVHAWAEYDRATLTGLQFTYPRWNGQRYETKLYCNLRTQRPKRLTFELCLAVAQYEQTGSAEALRILATGPRSLLLSYHIQALASEQKWDEARALAETTGRMTLRLAKDIWMYTRDSEPLERYVAKVLARDPYEPDVLAAQALLLGQKKQPEAARATLQKAMKYGLYRPEIRRDHLLRQLPEKKYQDMLKALEETDYHIYVLGYSTQLLTFDETPFRLEDTRGPTFECARLRVLERHARHCAWDDSHYSCRDGMRRDTWIKRAQDMGACGEKAPRSWQDRARALFGLDE